ncbi:uncharacterized protein LOC130453332 isoform X1 [Diorhabda sublineata]|uniref:uncharacterized protein LOC130453332 isoform X1 n=1 Tax=Diorhabda sublineata TaxID=1163346 RepID=UPI0024E11AC2|nr:uncharacterized protein LOC130453332 isoform X1 [Diorhabda sublineata]
MDPVNKQEMIKVIKDAGIYEDNMSKEQMEQYYKAVINSKDTSLCEKEPLVIHNSPEDMFESDIDSQTQLDNSDLETSSLKSKMGNCNKKSTDKRNFDMDILEENEDDSIPQDATKASFTFNDMPKDDGCPLEIIFHEPKYISVQNSKIFINADVQTKAEMLFDYHSDMEKLRADLSRQSFFSAPRPKPIQLTNFNYVSEAFEETEETYVSRAGRQTKRKIYNDDDDDDISTSPPKQPKLKSVEKPKWQSKTKPNKKVESAEEPMESDLTDVVQSEVPKISARSKKTLSNIEIMNRSTLFADSPLKRLTRAEKLFDKLKEDDLKKHREERELEAFEKTLTSNIEQSEQNEGDSIHVTNVDIEFPKRVIPPIPTKRKPINTRTQIQKTNVKNPAQQKEIELFEPVRPSTSQHDNSTNVQCPICARLFTEDVIEEHASNCGEEQVMATKVFTCKICDKVVSSNIRLHINVCKKRQEKIVSERE